MQQRIHEYVEGRRTWLERHRFHVQVCDCGLSAGGVDPCHSCGTVPKRWLEMQLTDEAVSRALIREAQEWPK